MRRLSKTLALVVVALAAGFGFVTWWVARATQQVPEFYQLAVQQPSQDLEQQKEELEARFEKLSKQVRRVGSWRVTFTSDQINAWLASELSDHFPDVLPVGTEDPRVMVQDGKVLVAARYKRGRVDTVISFELYARLTDEPNVVALQVHHLRAGALPIPINHFSDKISKAASRGDLQVRWEIEDENPIALVTVPSEHDRYVKTPVIIEKLELQEGEVFLSGHTGPQAHVAWNPGGPIYRLARSSSRTITQPH